MTEAQFESISLTIGITSLVCYMIFIMYNLSKESQAGKFGSLVIFGTLGLGMVGFITKEVLVAVLSAS